MKHPKTNLLTRSSLLLSEGIFLASAAGMADTVQHAAIFCVMLAAVLTLPVIVTFLLPKKAPSLLRAIVYSAAAALVYIPVMLLFQSLPENGISAQKGAVYLAVTVTAVLASPQRRRFLSAEGFSCLLKDIAYSLMSGTVFILFFGTVRELLGFGMLNGTAVLRTAPLPAMQYPFAGMMLAVLLSAVTVPSRSNGEVPAA